MNDISNQATKYEIVVVADENDGNYLTRISETTLEEIERLKPLIEAISKQDGCYNWATFEGGEKASPEKLYPGFEKEIEIFEEYVEDGDHGVHSIVNVYYYPKPERVVLL